MEISPLNNQKIEVIYPYTTIYDLITTSLHLSIYEILDFSILNQYMTANNELIDQSSSQLANTFIISNLVQYLIQYPSNQFILSIYKSNLQIKPFYHHREEDVATKRRLNVLGLKKSYELLTIINQEIFRVILNYNNSIYKLASYIIEQNKHNDEQQHNLKLYMNDIEVLQQQIYNLNLKYIQLQDDYNTCKEHQEIKQKEFEEELQMKQKEYQQQLQVKHQEYEEQLQVKHQKHQQQLQMKHQEHQEQLQATHQEHQEQLQAKHQEHQEDLAQQHKQLQALKEKEMKEEKQQINLLKYHQLQDQYNELEHTYRIELKNNIK